MINKQLTEEQFQAEINSMDDHGKHKPKPIDKIFSALRFHSMSYLDYKRIPTSILQELYDYLGFRAQIGMPLIVKSELLKRPAINLKREKRFFIILNKLYDNHIKDESGCPITVDTEGLGLPTIEICDSLNAKNSELLLQYSNGSFV